jgi:hypothetical protein
MLPCAGETVASIAQREFPPNESCNTRVSLLSRYGIKICLFDFDRSANALITLPSAERLLLMFAPSFRRSPVHVVYKYHGMQHVKDGR